MKVHNLMPDRIIRVEIGRATGTTLCHQETCTRPATLVLGHPDTGLSTVACDDHTAYALHELLQSLSI